jgi:hypothetical protein
VVRPNCLNYSYDPSTLVIGSSSSRLTQFYNWLEDTVFSGRSQNATARLLFVMKVTKTRRAVNWAENVVDEQPIAGR